MLYLAHGKEKIALKQQEKDVTTQLYQKMTQDTQLPKDKFLPEVTRRLQGYAYKINKQTNWKGDPNLLKYGNNFPKLSPVNIDLLDNACACIKMTYTCSHLTIMLMPDEQAHLVQIHGVTNIEGCGSPCQIDKFQSNLSQ